MFGRRAVVASALLLISMTSAVGGARSAPPLKCDGRNATIIGTPGNDVLVGTKHNDVIAGLGGDDRIDGAGGNDILCGGDGLDTLDYASSPSAVTVDLGAGTASGYGADRLVGFENVVGSAFGDSLTGDSGDNTLTGGDGNDTLAGAGGSDTADYSTAASAVTIDLAAGTATGAGSDTLSSIANAIGSPNDDNLYGDDGANALDGGAGADLLQSFGGADTLVGGPGDDIIRGGDGSDAADGDSGVDVCVDAEARTNCERGGGTLNVVMSTDFDYTDPALDYLITGWQLEYATCLKLMNFADDAPSASLAAPQPEAASGLPLVSADGRTYTFTIRDGFRFSPPSNEIVTAATFKHVIDRVLNPAMQSPATLFVPDITSTTANGQTLTITLAQPAPDLLARLAMPFFCAVPQSAPITQPSLSTPASAGPYFISTYTPNAQTIATRNPNYRGRRPSNFDRIVYSIGASPDTEQSEIDAGTADYMFLALTPTNIESVNALYGPGSAAAAIGRQRFFVNPGLGFQYIALNTSRPVFANETLRQAVATALDRQALVDLGPTFSGSATDQYLSPGTPGYADADIYSLHGNIAAAAALAASQGVTPLTPQTVELYTSNGTVSLARAALIRDTLAQIGLIVNIHAFPRNVQLQLEGTRGEPFDLTTESWILDYNDPADVINALLDGDTIKDTGNDNFSYFNDPVFNARMDAAAQLTGQARYDAYTTLEHDLVVAAPMVAYGTLNTRDYFADRIGCQVFGTYGMDLGSLCIH
jgi:ABC-type transport system substrate-binding protein